MELVKYLAGDCKVDVNFESERQGWTALMDASEKGHLNIVKYLVEEHNADMNAQSSTGMTPLMYAAKNGHVEVIRYFNSLGVDVDQTDNSGGTALMLASKYGHCNAVKCLVEQCAAQPWIVDSNNYSAYNYAGRNTNRNVQKYLSKLA